jgi:hypothetical protein
MLDYLIRVEFTVYAQIAIFLGLVILNYHVARQLPTRLFFGFTVFKNIIIMVIFLYFFLNWSTAVNPSLRTASVLGMSITNLFMLWQVILNRAEVPYQRALNACAKEPEVLGPCKEIVSKGKLFYYLRYLWHSLFSGNFPGKFLHDIAAEQIRYDIQTAFQKHGIEKNLINFQMQLTFLRRKLSEDETLPLEFKEFMGKVISQFEQHPWIEEHVNEFLHMIIVSPEKLFGSEWASTWQEGFKS